MKDASPRMRGCAAPNPPDERVGPMVARLHGLETGHAVADCSTEWEVGLEIKRWAGFMFGSLGDRSLAYCTAKVGTEMGENRGVIEMERICRS